MMSSHLRFPHSLVFSAMAFDNLIIMKLSFYVSPKSHFRAFEGFMNRMSRYHQLAFVLNRKCDLSDSDVDGAGFGKNM
jgi:hypothetical protein